MNVLLTGIYSKYTDGGDLYDALYVSATYPGLYLYKAPQEAPFPYCVYSIVTDDYDLDFVDEREDVSVQFNIFSENNSPSEAGTLLGYLKSMYDDTALTVSGYRHLFMVRDFVIPNNDFAEVVAVHGYSVQYTILLEKER